jgi:hypothetical protein
MTTPNGRFMTQKKICLSMSDCKFFNISEDKLIFIIVTHIATVWFFYGVFCFCSSSWNLESNVVCIKVRILTFWSSFPWFTPFCFLFYSGFWNLFVFFCSRDMYLMWLIVGVDYYFIVLYWCFQFMNAAYLPGFFHSWYVMVSSYFFNF